MSKACVCEPLIAIIKGKVAIVVKKEKNNYYQISCTKVKCPNTKRKRLKEKNK